MNFKEEALKELKKTGYKATGPRMAVLDVLDKKQIPLSAYQIEEALPKNIPVNVVTIYRVLELFEELGIVHKILSKQGYVKCDLEDKLSCHHFAICSTCDTVQEYAEVKKHDAKNKVPKSLHFKSLKHQSEILGTCEPCSEK